MKRTNNWLLGVLAAASLCTASCNKDSVEDVRTTQALTDCFATVTDLSTGTTTYINGIRIGIELNWTTTTADLTISGLRTDLNMPVLYVTGINWGVADAGGEWMKAAAPAITATALNYDIYNLTDFDLRWMDRMNLGPAIGNRYGYYPVTWFSFEINGQYRVVGSRNPIMTFGTTTSTSPAGEEFKSTDTYYEVEVDVTTMTANIGIHNAQFAQPMPALNMIFPDVPVTIDAQTGVITLNAPDGFIPTLSDKIPQPNYPITSLSGTINPLTGMDLQFTCNVMQRLLYTVTAELNYTDFTLLSK